MKNSDSVIQFEKYFLDEVFFEIKDEEYIENSIDINPKFSVDFDDCIAKIKLEFCIEEDLFYLKGSLIGVFSFEETQEEDKISELLVINGVTILFPYLRSAISTISNAVNVPTIIIPTINVIEYLQNKYEENITD